ncbi:MAG: phosphatase PAP2 family protein [Clostridiales bacterium]|nr:phosphatase PAP2 family protein [Clostridiales bacterium]
MSAFAEWLNTFFAGFDESVFTFAHNLHEGGLGGFFDWFFETITHLGDSGLYFILLAVVLMLFKKTRKCGVAILIAIGIGALITNVIVKPLVARPRPYIDETGIYYQWWLEIGHGLESEYSFPSGHTTVAFSGLTALFWNTNRKYSWTALILAGLIAFSRIYLYVHYPSDILGGTIVGVTAAVLACLLANLIDRKLEPADGRLPVFIRDASLEKLWKKSA